MRHGFPTFLVDMVVLFSVIKMFAWTCQPLQMRLPCCLITMQTNDPVLGATLQ